MKSRARNQSVRQPATSLNSQLGQILLPMVAGVVATKQELLAWVYDRGLAALDEVLRGEAERLVGPKGKHNVGRQYNHWGSTRTTVPFGGRRLAIKRPRVRGKDGAEAPLSTLECFRDLDPMPERVVEQIVLGVSTRGYERSLDAPPAGPRAFGASKSAASRQLVKRTKAKVNEQLSRRLDNIQLVAMMLDGIQVAKHTVVVALGIDAEGKKLPLGIWQGSTENAAVCTSLLQDLIARGLRIEERILCVIDGGKGLRKALSDVLGDRAVVQRCQQHKTRNVKDHVSKGRQPYVGRSMSEAYRSGIATTARKRLRSLASWLERNGEESAAASLREGLEETLTVLKLGLPATLRRSLATTNAIENLMGTIRRVTRNVKRWRNGSMARPWVGLGVVHAAHTFHRVKEHRDIPKLINALKQADQIDAECRVA